jgi:hypothetical protein
MYCGQEEDPKLDGNDRIRRNITYWPSPKLSPSKVGSFKYNAISSSWGRPFTLEMSDRSGSVRQWVAGCCHSHRFTGAVTDRIRTNWQWIPFSSRKVQKNSRTNSQEKLLFSSNSFSIFMLHLQRKGQHARTFSPLIAVITTHEPRG